MLLDFNSMMVQLKLSLTLQYLAIVRFQFHNGTIKTILMSVNDTYLKIFQFHNGTIKTESCTMSTSKPSAFQFHNGTIKTEV